MNKLALRPLEAAKNLIYAQEEKFTALAAEFNSKAVAFKREAEFAMQLLQGSDYLLKAAQNSPESLENAILNVASTGLSLNPVDRQAYLIPRAGKVCLDISYIGMSNLATESDSIKWVKAEVVYKNDSFSSVLDEKPQHQFDAFSKDRGEIIGAYCVAKTADGDYLTETMSIDEIYKIAERSQAYKKNSGPWKTDLNEMIKKTVIKRAAKLWPKVTQRLSNAIGVVNEHEGIDFKGEENQPITEDQSVQIISLLAALDKEDGAFLTHLSNLFKREVASLNELTNKEAVLAITQLKQFAEKLKG